MPNALNLQMQLLVDGVWTTYPGYSELGWSSRIGPDVESGLQPNQLTFTLNNDDLSMDPTTAASPLYGKIGRNTPARILIDGTTLTRPKRRRGSRNARSSTSPAPAAACPRSRSPPKGCCAGWADGMTRSRRRCAARSAATHP
jgi:hypothetical protein